MNEEYKIRSKISLEIITIYCKKKNEDLKNEAKKNEGMNCSKLEIGHFIQFCVFMLFKLENSFFIFLLLFLVSFSYS